MEWMRCNSCWLKVGESQQNHQVFSLTQCGHIYCFKCISKAEERCPQCGTTNTISLPLEQPLNPQIEHYFQSPVDLTDKVRQAAQFQEAQLTLCLQRGDACEKKYQSLKSLFWSNNESLKATVEKYNKLKMMVIAMQREQRGKATHHVPPVLKTPVNQIESRQHSSQYRFRDQQIHDCARRNDGVFRVPTITRVPKSAGYHSLSTTSSTRMSSSTSDYSSTFTTPE